MNIFLVFVNAFEAAIWFGLALGFLPAPLWVQTVAFAVLGISGLVNAHKRWVAV